MTSITVYDGARTIGGTKIYLEEEKEGILLDFGMNFAKEREYFQDFMTPRRSRGIYDYLTLNLIPKLNIYRRDLIPGDIFVSQYPTLNIQAVLLSHAHMDHFGNIGLLRRDIPVIASSTSIALMKAILDSSNSSLSNEAAFFGEKEQKEKDNRVIKSTYADHYIGRHFFSVDSLSPDLNTFMKTCTKAKTKCINGIDVSPLADFNSQFHIQSYPVDHSILGATAYLIEGETTVAYTGDFRLHGRQGERSKKFIKNAKDASILIIEGTRVTREDDYIISEETVYQNCLSTIEAAQDLVVVNFSNRNVERLETFKKIAEDVGRQLVIPGKIGYLLKALECADGQDHSNKIRLLKKLKGSHRTWEGYILQPEDEEMENTRLFGEYFTQVDPQKIKDAPEQYILCLSFYDLKQLLDIRPNTGTYIYSSSEAFSEESEFDFVRFYHWLEFFGFNVHGMSLEQMNGVEYPVFTEGYHSSGHVNKEGLRWAVNTIDPDLIIPVHTEHPEWFEGEFDGVLLPKEGQEYTV
ncbi:MAG: MBL fold metallo-hydrolase [Promethearchaeia archaeon]